MTDDLEAIRQARLQELKTESRPNPNQQPSKDDKSVLIPLTLTVNPTNSPQLTPTAPQPKPTPARPSSHKSSTPPPQTVSGGSDWSSLRARKWLRIG